jgi:signal transduction histidine kinase
VSVSPVREFLSFRRTFALLIMLVVVPSAGLSGFGIVAILNERAAVEKRLELAWTGKLDALGDVLRETLQASSFTPTPQGLEVVTRGGRRLTEGGFVMRDGGRVETQDERVRIALAPILDQLAGLPAGPALFTVTGPQGVVLLATRRDAGVLHGARLGLASVDALVDQLGARLLSGDEGVRFALVAEQREAADTFNRLVSEVQARAAAAGARASIAELALPPPLQDLRLAVLPGGEDPVALTATRNRAVYGTLLGLFYVTLVVGVVLTGRSLYREARLSRIKTDFVSLVSHELRTPLTSIRMFIETLALGRVSDPAQTQLVLGMLLQETERLSALIERVLDWGRIESGRKQYRMEPTGVGALVETALGAFRAQRLGTDAALVVELPEGLPDVLVDREAMAGALLNLLQNAYKYGGSDKRIAVRARREGRALVALDVEDHGAGIAPRHRKRIFERFYRVDNLLTRRTEGSGLGLSIAKRIVEAHQGRISVTSELGHGSTFTLHLPVARGGAPATAPAGAPATTPAAAPDGPPAGGGAGGGARGSGAQAGGGGSGGAPEAGGPEERAAR